MATRFEEWNSLKGITVDGLETEVISRLHLIEEDSESSVARLPSTPKGSFPIEGPFNATIHWGKWYPEGGYTWSQLLDHWHSVAPRGRLKYFAYRDDRFGKKDLKLAREKDPDGMGRFFTRGTGIMYRIFINDFSRVAYIGETTVPPFIRFLQHFSNKGWEEPSHSKAVRSSTGNLLKRFGAAEAAKKIRLQIKYIWISPNSVPIGPARLIAELYHILSERPTHQLIEWPDD